MSSTCTIRHEIIVPEHEKAAYNILNLLSAIWRIYPSSTWSSQWPYDGYIRHGWMTSCVRGRDSATRECFGRGSQGTIFVRSSKLTLFFPELCPFRRVFFCFPRFSKIWRQTFKLWGFWFRRCLGGHFENSAPSPGIFLRTLTTWTTTTSTTLAKKIETGTQAKHRRVHARQITRLCHVRAVVSIFLARVVFFWKFPFFLPKQSRCYLPDRYGDPQAEQSTLVMEHRRLEWKLDFRALARLSAEGPWIIVAIGTSHVRRSMVHAKEKKNTRKSACDCAKAQPFIIYKPASFEEPVSETRCR